MTDTFKLCSVCRKPLPYGGQYYQCSVSTCQRKRTALYFCSLPCFEAHLPGARHRDAWAELETAPAGPSPEDDAAGDDASIPSRDHVEPTSPRRRVLTSPSSSTEASNDILVVVSKLKRFIKEGSGMNTSDGVVGVLSDHLRALSTAACQEAAQDGRKTVLDRDFEAVVRRLRTP